MTAICASHYRNPLNDYVGKKHQSQSRFRQSQSSRSSFYRPGLRVEVTDESRSDQSSSSSSKESPHSSQHEAVSSATSPANNTTAAGHWGFRPSALQCEDYGTGDMGIDEIVDCYVRDNERAEREGVIIPPRPSLKALLKKQNHPCSAGEASSQPPRPQLRDVKDALFSASSSSLSTNPLASPSSASSSSSGLRCLQWNIQAFSSPKDERNTHTITAGIIRTICETNSDVLVLNEIHWREQQEQEGHWVFHSSESTKRAIQSSQNLLEEFLRLSGYRFLRVASHGDTPTMVGIRSSHKVLDFKEIVLSDNRSALCVLIQNETPGSSRCWVVGTHLDAFDAKKRKDEIRKLVTAMDGSGDSSSVPVLIMGDFNQQRARDYTPPEWKRIASSAKLRKVPLDDGVATTLQDAGFRCVLDTVGSADEAMEDSHETHNPADNVACNWNPNHPPPSTHWSGTTIDYTYYSNQQDNHNNTAAAAAKASTTTIAPHGVYVSPAGFSDHRMTVTDWTLTTTTANHGASSSTASSPQHEESISKTYIDKSFFFQHLPAGRHHTWLYR